jgi:hypothetical protein
MEKQMIPSKHSSPPGKWETTKGDKETGRYGKEGSKKEEAFDRKQMTVPKPRK